MKFGTDDQQQAWLEECRQAKRTQRVQFAVSPRQQFVTPDRRTLRAGDEFIATRDLRATTKWVNDENSGIPKQVSYSIGEQLHDLLERLVIVQASGFVPGRLPPEAA